MLNNKGFAVTTVLYTLLIAFLMFLGAALAQFSSSSSLIGKANDDLINGTKLDAKLVKVEVEDADNWNKDDWNKLNIIVKINSRYGTMYWPKDFCNNKDGTLSDCKEYNNISVMCNGNSCDNIVINDLIGIDVTDDVTGDSLDRLQLFNAYE